MAMERLQLMAQSCLYLACKAEETLRKVRDVINTCYFLLQPRQPMLKIGKVPFPSPYHHCLHHFMK